MKDSLKINIPTVCDIKLAILSNNRFWPDYTDEFREETALQIAKGRVKTVKIILKKRTLLLKSPETLGSMDIAADIEIYLHRPVNTV